MDTKFDPAGLRNEWREEVPTFARQRAAAPDDADLPRSEQ